MPAVPRTKKLAQTQKTNRKSQARQSERRRRDERREIKRLQNVVPAVAGQADVTEVGFVTFCLINWLQMRSRRKFRVKKQFSLVLIIFMLSSHISNIRDALDTFFL